MVVWMGLLFLERTDGREGSEFRTKQLNLLNQLNQREITVTLIIVLRLSK